MTTIIKDLDFMVISKAVRPDSRKRVILPKALAKEGIIYNISRNRIGQILLDPQVIIPASELWVFENKDILTAMDKSMAEERVINRGSFAKYVKNAP